MAKITRHTTDSEIGGQIYRGALALQTLFESANSSYHPNVPVIKERILSSIDLTQGQTNYFNKTAKRVEIATNVVSLLKKRFGVSKRGNIVDRKGLISAIGPDSIGSYYTKIKPNGLSFGLFPSKWTKKNNEMSGFVSEAYKQREVLDLPLSEIISSINENNFIGFELFSYVVAPEYFLNDQVDYLKSESTLLHEKIFGKRSDFIKLYSESIERHEQKHLFDYLIGNEFIILFAETSAHLYATPLKDFSIANSLKGFYRDYKLLNKKLEKYNDKLEFLNKKNSPSVLMVYNKTRRDQCGSAMDFFYEFEPLFEKQVKEIDRMNKKYFLSTLSFVFSAIEAHNQEQYLQKLKRNFQLATDYILEKSDSQLGALKKYLL